ncbi:MAG TPA: hypothetical protein VFG30_06970 [Polyangiales bacterium]|nr:hypothetical protein [Polyangiales bacterium]
MEALKRAAERMLQALGEQTEDSLPEAAVERMSVDVRIGDQTEVVVLRLRSGQLQTSCTCGVQRCAHAQHAMRWLVEPQTLQLPVSGATKRSSPRLERVLVERERGGSIEPRSAGTERSTLIEARAASPTVLALDSLPARASIPLDVRPIEARPAPPRANPPALAEALEDAVTALVRSGLLAEHSASVSEMLSRVAREAGTPLPLGVARWIGRVRDAIDQRDVALIAHALAAAGAVAADLREAHPGEDAQERLVTWLGDTHGFGMTRVSDRLLLEVAREWLNGGERQQIERRYLVDLNSGESYREERPRRAHLASVGGCPRLIGVGFAEVEQGAAPHRMHLLQYTTTPSIDRASWDLLAAWAQRDSQALAAAYRESLSRQGALSEPFALVMPDSLELTPIPALILDRGPPLPIGVDDDSGALDRFIALSEGTATASDHPQRPLRIAWVAGRLFDRDGLLLLKPLAVGILTSTGLRHERL